MKQESLFGKGFLYCLILYVKHYGELREKIKQYKKTEYTEKEAIENWFYGASDHLFELECPKRFKNTTIDNHVNYLLKILKEGRFEGISLFEIEKSIDLIEEIMFIIDKELGVNPIESDFR